jgi:NADH-quinone oxidoreductase subunit E
VSFTETNTKSISAESKLNVLGGEDSAELSYTDTFVSDAKLEESCTVILSRYPQQFSSKYSSAVMPLLYLVQERVGFVSNKGIRWVAEKLNIAPVRVLEIATFYTMFHLKPTGCYHIQLCRTLSCFLVGAQELGSFITNRIAKDNPIVGERSLWSYEEVECLGSCGTAPLCQINDLFFENLTIPKMEDLMNSLEDFAKSFGAKTSGAKSLMGEVGSLEMESQLGSELRLSAINESFGSGILKFSPSQIR